MDKLEMIHKRWRLACVEALQDSFDFLYSRGTPSLVKSIYRGGNKSKDRGEIFSILWRYSPEKIAWLNLAHVKEFPRPGFLDAPVVCSIAANSSAPRMGEFTYQWIVDHGGKPNFARGERPITWTFGALDYYDAYEHPPGLVLHCLPNELSRCCVSVIQWHIEWRNGTSHRPFDGSLPRWSDPPGDFVTTSAERTLAAWHEKIRNLTPREFSAILDLRRKFIARGVDLHARYGYR